MCVINKDLKYVCVSPFLTPTRPYKVVDERNPSCIFRTLYINSGQLGSISTGSSLIKVTSRPSFLRKVLECMTTPVCGNHV